MLAHKKIINILTASGRGKYRIYADIRCIGDDILIALWGGTKPHIGSVVLSTPRPSLNNTRDRSVTSSVYNCIGHKDEAVARLVSEKVAVMINRITVVTAGIHIDNMTEYDLRNIMKNVEIIVSKVQRKIRKKLQ